MEKRFLKKKIGKFPTLSTATWSKKNKMNCPKKSMNQLFKYVD